MTTITQVLCAADFSEFSRRAFDHAAAMARWYRARLTVLHVVPIQPIMDLPPVPMSGEDRERILAEVTRFIRQASPDILFET